MHAQLLVFEDDPTTCELLQDAFTDEGYSVAVCESCDDILARAKLSASSLALVDFWGESQTVLSAAERAEIVELAARVPTVLMSGRRWAREHQASDLGLLAIVPKPFNLSELYDLVALWVTRLREDSAEALATSRALRAQVGEALDHLQDCCQQLSHLHDEAVRRRSE